MEEELVQVLVTLCRQSDATDSQAIPKLILGENFKVSKTQFEDRIHLQLSMHGYNYCALPDHQDQFNFQKPESVLFFVFENQMCSSAC